jgi:hypothetical protein
MAVAEQDHGRVRKLDHLAVQAAAQRAILHRQAQQHNQE